MFVVSAGVNIAWNCFGDRMEVCLDGIEWLLSADGHELLEVHPNQRHGTYGMILKNGVYKFWFNDCVVYVFTCFNTMSKVLYSRAAIPEASYKCKFNNAVYAREKLMGRDFDDCCTVGLIEEIYGLSGVFNVFGEKDYLYDYNRGIAVSRHVMLVFNHEINIVFAYKPIRSNSVFTINKSAYICCQGYIFNDGNYEIYSRVPLDYSTS